MSDTYDQTTIENHELEIAYNKLAEKYEKLLQFAKDTINEIQNDEEIYDSNITVTLKGYTYTKAEFQCSYIMIRAQKLLKEIGE